MMSCYHSIFKSYVIRDLWTTKSKMASLSIRMTMTPKLMETTTTPIFNYAPNS